MGGKKHSKKTVTITRQFTYAYNGVVFRFLPGERWTVEGDYPGNPSEKTIAKSLYLELKPLNLFK